MRSFVIGSFLLAAACSTNLSNCTKHHPEMFTPRSAIASRESLNGVVIVVAGYVVAEFENYGIWQSEETFGKWESESSCISLLIPKKLSEEIKRHSGQNLVLRGKFISDIREKNLILLGSCNFSTLEVQSVGGKLPYK